MRGPRRHDRPVRLPGIRLWRAVRPGGLPSRCPHLARRRGPVWATVDRFHRHHPALHLSACRGRAVRSARLAVAHGGVLRHDRCLGGAVGHHPELCAGVNGLSAPTACPTVAVDQCSAGGVVGARSRHDDPGAGTDQPDPDGPRRGGLPVVPTEVAEGTARRTHRRGQVDSAGLPAVHPGQEGCQVRADRRRQLPRGHRTWSRPRARCIPEVLGVAGDPAGPGGRVVLGGEPVPSGPARQDRARRALAADAVDSRLCNGPRTHLCRAAADPRLARRCSRPGNRRGGGTGGVTGLVDPPLGVGGARTAGPGRPRQAWPRLAGLRCRRGDRSRLRARSAVPYAARSAGRTALERRSAAGRRGFRPDRHRLAGRRGRIRPARSDPRSSAHGATNRPFPAPIRM